jgi:hypothetical protein
VNRVVEDEERKALRAMADGSMPFEEVATWEKVSALDWRDLKKLDARTRLALGYYTAAKRRAAQTDEAMLSGHVAR